MESEHKRQARQDRSVREIRRALQREQHWITKYLQDHELEDVIHAVFRLR